MAACKGDVTGTGELATPLLNADVAAMAADAAGEDVDIMREPVFFISIGPFAALVGPFTVAGTGDLRPANCPYDAASQRLICPVVTRGSITINRSYAFWDAGNVSQQAYDGLLTAKANIQTSIVGSKSGDNWSASISRTRDMTATGLLGEETQRTWNGTGTSNATGSRHNDSGAERSYDITCTLTVTDVVVPVPIGHPLSGTITRQCTVTFDGGPRDGESVQRTATVTFNGTSTATLTVGDKTFDLDLTNRRRSPRNP
ncbi:MAG: hypothetical protein HOP28_04225 [Gemmatimonadales bacterium]|nr:hypothetical protein [Gemmatimonadales bacterium]